MEEKTLFEEAVEYAEKQGIKYTTHVNVQRFRIAPNISHGTTKFVTLDLEDRMKGLFLVFYYSHASVSLSMGVYSGLFLRKPNCKARTKVVRRFWPGLLSFKKRIKTGSSEIDRKTTITSENGELDLDFFNSKILLKYIDISSFIKPLEMLSIVDSNSMVPELHGHNIIALRTNTWVTDKGKLDRWIDQSIQLFENMNK